MKRLFIVPFLLISGLAIAQKISYSGQMQERDYRNVRSDFSKFLLYYAWRSENNSFMPAYLALNDENQLIELPKPEVTGELRDTRITIDTVFQLGDNLVECYSRLGDDAVKDQYFVLRDRNYEAVASSIVPAKTARTRIVADESGFYIMFKMKNDLVQIVRLDNNLKLKLNTEMELTGFKNPYLQTLSSGPDNSLILAYTETLSGRAYLHSDVSYFEKICRIQPNGKISSFEVEKLPGVKIQQQFLSFNPDETTYTLLEIVGMREEGESGTPNNVVNFYKWDFAGKVLDQRSEKITLPDLGEKSLPDPEFHFSNSWSFGSPRSRLMVVTPVFRAGRDAYERSRLMLEMENGSILRKTVVPDSPSWIIGRDEPFSADGEKLRFLNLQRTGPTKAVLVVTTVDLENFDRKTQQIDVTLDGNYVPSNFMASSGPDCILVRYHVLGGHDAVFVTLDFEED